MAHQKGGARAPCAPMLDPPMAIPSSAHVALNVTESEQDREDSDWDLEPERRKD